jgi:CheY-like chemotaxis protein
MSGGSPTVLVADAQSESALLLTRILAADGFTVNQVGDGRQALQRALFHPPALVVTDFHLPFINGLELCAILRRDRSTSSIPLIMVTDEHTPAVLEQAPPVTDAVFIRPVDPGQLIDKVHDLLARGGNAVYRSRQIRAKLRLEVKAAGQFVPPAAAPVLHCPDCNSLLIHLQTHMGGVGAKRERWDDYRCPRGCGDFNYRHRTKRIRRIA